MNCARYYRISDHPDWRLIGPAITRNLRFFLITVELNCYGGNEVAANAGCEAIHLYISKYYNGLLNDFPVAA
jgi:hypothetical protein